MIKSLSEFLNAIDILRIPNSDVSSTTLPWYRGQADSLWHLIPTLYRGSWDPGREREMTRDFRLRALMEIEHPPLTYLEWLFVMQHYGLPTRLLDWTESCLVALYFAVERFDDICNATVWVLHPWTLNKHPDSFGQRSVPPISEDMNTQYCFPDYTVTPLGQTVAVIKEMPMALRPAHTTRRIVAQRGQFTVHGHERSGLDQMPNLKLDLKQVKIDGSKKLSILRELYKAGICRYTLFPDIVGLAEEISVRYSSTFMG